MSDSMDQFPIPCPDPDARPPQKLAHIVLATRRFDEAIHWWSIVLRPRDVSQCLALLPVL